MKYFLIIDNHYVIRTGIRFILNDLYHPASVYEAPDIQEAKTLLKERSYDLLFLEVQLPDAANSLKLMEFIKSQYPGTRVLVYSMSSATIYARRFLREGAMGFLSKDATLKQITTAINSLMDNKYFLSEAVAGLLAENTYSGGKINPFENLSKREYEIAKLLLDGVKLTEISHKLAIGTSTVGTHKQRMFEKLAVSNLLELKELATTYHM